MNERMFSIFSRANIQVEKDSTFCLCVEHEKSIVDWPLLIPLKLSIKTLKIYVSGFKERWFKLTANFLFYFRINESGSIDWKEVIMVIIYSRYTVKLPFFEYQILYQTCSFKHWGMSHTTLEWSYTNSHYL
jgi:hypothetical protein